MKKFQRVGVLRRLEQVTKRGCEISSSWRGFETVPRRMDCQFFLILSSDHKFAGESLGH